MQIPFPKVRETNSGTELLTSALVSLHFPFSKSRVVTVSLVSIKFENLALISGASLLFKLFKLPLTSFTDVPDTSIPKCEQNSPASWALSKFNMSTSRAKGRLALRQKYAVLMAARASPLTCCMCLWTAQHARNGSLFTSLKNRTKFLSIMHVVMSKASRNRQLFFTSSGKFTARFKASKEPRLCKR